MKNVISFILCSDSNLHRQGTAFEVFINTLLCYTNSQEHYVIMRKSYEKKKKFSVLCEEIQMCSI